MYKHSVSGSRLDLNVNIYKLFKNGFIWTTSLDICLYAWGPFPAQSWTSAYLKYYTASGSFSTSSSLYLPSSIFQSALTRFYVAANEEPDTTTAMFYDKDVLIYTNPEDFLQHCFALEIFMKVRCLWCIGFL